MKRIYLLIPLLLVFILVSCGEIYPPDVGLSYNNPLTQTYDFDNPPKDITFTVELENFYENKLKKEDYSIKWFEDDIPITEYNDKTDYKLVINGTKRSKVEVEVTYKYREETHVKKLREDVKVTEVPVRIDLYYTLNNKDEFNDSIVDLRLGEEDQVKVNALISNNLSYKNARWVVKNIETEVEEYIDIDLTKSLNKKNQNTGLITLAKDFKQAGAAKYQVFLDIDRYRSNFIFVNVGYGDFKISTDQSKLTQTKNYSNRTLTMAEVSEELGEGSYYWILNEEKLESTKNQLTFIHENKDVGGYLYYGVFEPIDKSLGIIKTEPVLITNGIEVATVSEFYDALDNKTKAIVLTKDLNFEGYLLDKKATIKIENEITIVGNGHTMKNPSVDTFITIDNVNNVYFKDITIDRSELYNVHYFMSENGYMEDVIFKNSGASGGLTALNAGLYVENSIVTIKNVSIKYGGSVGIRVEGRTNRNQFKHTVLTVLGEFDAEELLLPIASGRSESENITFIGNGFSEFVIPLLDVVIKRWSNDKEGVHWILFNPNKTGYYKNEALDVFGITIDVRFGSSENDKLIGELELVYLFLDNFNQYGTIEFFDETKTKIHGKYYIIDHNDNGKYNDTNYQFGLDKLLYTDSPDGENWVRPIVPQKPGIYYVRITIGDELDLGFFEIKVH